MAKFNLVKGFKDPDTRPRFIIWTGVVVLLLAVVVVVALGVTSTKWFCAKGCHKVQDDSIIAYQKSTHSEISCMACHMPVNANPIVFVLHKMKALGELYLTVTDKFELPLNPHSHLSLSEEMESDKCTQCHNLKNREVTPSKGIIISHEKHEEAKPVAAAEVEYWNEIQCTWCHNRIAHNEEGWDLTLKNPDGEESHKHENYMTMDACFRCHTLTDTSISMYKAPGACGKCHPKDFKLKPESHEATSFYPEGHADMAKEMKSEAASALAEFEKRESEAESDKEKAPLPPVEAVFYCTTCHVEATFCTRCHGMDMPHSTEFKEKKHPEVAKTKMDKCDLCHNVKKTGYTFCNNCHHGAKSNWTFDAKTPWVNQHAKAVTKNGVKGCIGACHKDTTFCLNCHKKLTAPPSSHKAGDFLRKYGADLGVHAANFKAQPEGCEICHGAKMPNGNAFCKACHKYEVPHPDTFKKNHLASGLKDKAKCQYCHNYKEVCSNCHHKGASATVSWLSTHGGIVNKQGGAACFEACHDKGNDCVKCHTARKVLPASHKAGNWTRDKNSKTTAVHASTYQKAAEACAYCHGKNEPNTNTFCKACHKLEMPHPSGFGPADPANPVKGQGGTHSKLLTEKKVAEATCLNCHAASACNECHHKYTAAKPWVNAHPDTVKKSGSAECFKCHEETFCSYCHVREAQKYIKR